MDLGGSWSVRVYNGIMEAAASVVILCCILGAAGLLVLHVLIMRPDISAGRKRVERFRR